MPPILRVWRGDWPNTFLSLNTYTQISPSTAQQARLAHHFRNLIHPGRQIRLQQKCDRGTPRSAPAAVDLAIRDLEARFALGA
jgi:hypothetical protein